MIEMVGTAIFWVENHKYEFELPEKLSEIKRYISEYLLFDREVVVELSSGEIIPFDAYLKRIKQTGTGLRCA
ncbi:hypothetical protein D6779_00850 [Candidatus Parcubacteria bacterium]|nr:MAG: hypothetical protein D6779_00850 [Candidatus Parcubacteria bacterium]